MARPALDDLDLVMKTMATTIVDNTEYFSQLDAVVGDGDFGYSLRSGFEVVAADYDTFDRSSVGAVLKKIGIIISGKVGGVERAVLGNRIPARRHHRGRQDRAHVGGLIAMLRASVDGIMARGGASLGEKTLLDALVPAIDSLEESFREPITDHGVAALQTARPTWRSRLPKTRRACSPCAAVPHTPASEAAIPSTPARPPSA